MRGWQHRNLASMIHRRQESFHGHIIVVMFYPCWQGRQFGRNAVKFMSKCSQILMMKCSWSALACPPWNLDQQFSREAWGEQYNGSTSGLFPHPPYPSELTNQVAISTTKQVASHVDQKSIERINNQVAMAMTLS